MPRTDLMIQVRKLCRVRLDYIVIGRAFLLTFALFVVFCASVGLEKSPSLIKFDFIFFEKSSPDFSPSKDVVIVMPNI